MTDYAKTTNFTAKDSLPSGNAAKKILGSLFDTEFDNIQTAVATKYDSSDLGSTLQAFGAVLDDFNTLGVPASDGQFIVATGAGAFAYESGATVRTSLGLGSGDSPTFTGLNLTGNASMENSTSVKMKDVGGTSWDVFKLTSSDSLEVGNNAVGSLSSLSLRVPAAGTGYLDAGGVIGDWTSSGLRLGSANARVTTILDEDAMGSDSATALATQQSIKAYVDSSGGGALEYITTLSPSASSSAEFTSLSSDYIGYRFVFEGMYRDDSSTDTDLEFEVREASTWITTAATYSYTHQRDGTTDSGSSGSVPVTEGNRLVGNATSADNRACGFAEVVGIGSSMGTTINGLCYAEDVSHSFHGGRISAVEADGLRFVPTAGTFTGTIYVYGIKDS